MRRPAILSGPVELETIPISQPTLPDFEAYVRELGEIFATGQITNGRWVRRFEEQAAGLLGVDDVLEGEGLDLSDVVGKGSATGRDAAVCDTWYLNANRASIWTSDWQCQKDFGSINAEKDKLFVEGCYDRKADPDFENPVDRPELMARLEAWRAEHSPEQP